MAHPPIDYATATMRWHAVLFDLDGTLTDAVDGIAGSIQYALRALGRPVPDAADLRWCVGPPIREVFVQLLGVDGRAEEAIGIYRERYGTRGLFENRVYPGVMEMLAHTQAQGAHLFVCTSKRRRFAERIAQHFALGHFFTGIFGSEDDGRFESKADLVREIVESRKLDSSNVVLVGDREHDVRAAVANDIMSIGVTYGYGSKNELVAAGARVICHSPAEVAKVLGAQAESST